MKIRNVLTLVGLGSMMALNTFANDTVLLNQDRLSVVSLNVVIERTEMTPEKVKIDVPIVFPRTYCTGYSTYTRNVPCPDYSGSNSGSGHSGGNSGPGNDPRPNHGNPGRPPHPGTSPHPHNKCTETYRTCDGYATRYVTEDRTLTLKFKKDAIEYSGTELYKILGEAISEEAVDFDLVAINDLAKSHKLKKHGRKHFVVK